MRALSRLQAAESACVGEILSRLHISGRRKLKERVLFPESRAISVMWRRCKALRCCDIVKASSGPSLRKFLDTVCWDVIQDKHQLLHLLRKVGGYDVEDDFDKPAKIARAAENGSTSTKS